MEEELVFWGYKSKNGLYHLYPDCTDLNAAFGFCKGTLQDAIKVGASTCCENCKSRKLFEKSALNSGTCTKPETDQALVKKKEAKTEQHAKFGYGCVYWRKDFNNLAWHLYKDCEYLAEKDVESGTVEQAINRGMSCVCATCRKRYDSLHPIQSGMRYEPMTKPINEELIPVLASKEPKSECKIRVEPEKKKKTEISVWAAIALCVCFLFAGYLWRNNSVKSELENEWNAGYSSGYDEGYEEGNQKGYNTGYSCGKSNGHNEGYYAGYNDATENLYADEYRNQTGDVVVYVTKTGKKYHRLDCSYLNDPVYYMTLSQAKKDGYTACSRCDPPQ